MSSAVKAKPVSQMTPDERIAALEASLAVCRSMAKDLINGYPAGELCAADPQAALEQAADLLNLDPSER